MKIIAVKKDGSGFGPRGSARLTISAKLDIDCQGVDTIIPQDDLSFIPQYLSMHVGNRNDIYMMHLNYEPRYNTDMQGKMLTSAELLSIMQEYEQLLYKFKPTLDTRHRIDVIINNIKTQIPKDMDGDKSISVHAYYYPDRVYLEGYILPEHFLNEFKSDEDELASIKRSVGYTSYSLNIPYDVAETFTFEKYMELMEDKIEIARNNYRYSRARYILDKKVDPAGMFIRVDADRENEGQYFLTIASNYGSGEGKSLKLHIKNNKQMLDYAERLTDGDVRAMAETFQVQKDLKERLAREKAAYQEEKEDRSTVKERKVKLEETWNSLDADFIKMMASD